MVPVLKSLTQQHHVKVLLVAPEVVAPLFKELKNVKIIPISKGLKLPKLVELVRFSNKLQKKSFDYIADCHDVIRSKLLRLILSPRGNKVAIIDKGRKEKKTLTSYPKKDFYPIKATFQRYADVFNSLGFPISVEIPPFITSTNRSQNDKKKIGIAPFSQHAGKSYPLELMQHVVGKLNKKNFEILLFGAPNETKLLDSWSQKFNIINTSSCSLDKQLDLISGLDLMVSMDSANGHMAANYGVKVLTIWGMTHPFLGFKPIGQPDKHQILLDRTVYPKVPTSVFGKKLPIEYKNAMHSISPDMIIYRINQIL